MNHPSSDDREPASPPPGLILEPVPGTFGICRMSPKARIPRWVHRSAFYSVCRSSEELSILCEGKLVPNGVRCERGWSAIKVSGTLDLSLIGVLASLAGPLAEARIGLFTVSTYDTDYLLVREQKLSEAIAVLRAAGHRYDDAPEVPAAAEPAAESRETEPVPEVAQTSVEEPSAEEPSAEEPSAEEPSAEERESRDARKPARRSAFARVLSEFGLGRKGEEPPAEEPSPAAAARKAEEPPDEPAAVETPGTAAAVATAEPEPAAPEAEAAETSELEPEAEPGAADVEPEARPAAAAVEDGAESEGLFTGAIPQHEVEVTDKSFEDLGISAPILETVREVGFEHPTPIQARVIPVSLEGFDVIGLAETGSGKTAAFCLPMAERLTHGKGIRGLILCPTREIALQTKAFLDIFGRDHELETVVVIGGVKMGPQISGLSRHPDIIVATPGRLADHMRRRNVRLDKIEEMVLDEADHMLDLGFLPQIKEILQQVPRERQTLMFSATMPPPIERLAQQFMRNPTMCDIRPEGQLAAGIEHRLYLVKDEDKKACLFALLEEVEGSTLVFVRRKLYTEWLARQIELGGFPVARIHSDRSQAQRVEALRAFREGKVRILVATDVAARGIDVPRIQHVVNFGLPEQTEDYVHRAGRTARGSAAGIVSTIGTWQDKLMVRDIELDLGIELPRRSAPGVQPYTELPKRKTVRRRRLL